MCLIAYFVKGDSQSMRISKLGLLAAMFGASLYGQQPTPLKVGDTAPDFTLQATTGQKVTLSEFKGKKAVVVAFFPAAFTGG